MRYIRQSVTIATNILGKAIVSDSLKLGTHYALRPDPTTPDRREYLNRLIFVPTICEGRVGSEQCVHGRERSGMVGSGRKGPVCVHLKL